MKNISFLGLLLCIIFLSSCSEKFIRNKEARDDAVAMNKALQLQSRIEHKVLANRETEPVSCQSVDDDAADDPAFWLNIKQPQKSIIYGSNKKAGIHVYDLSGKELQFVPCGKINNIDVRQNVSWGNRKVDILAGSNRSKHTIDFFMIKKDGLINSQPDYSIDLGKFNPYGFCLGLDKKNNLYAFVNGKDGDVIQYAVTVDSKNQLINKKERRLKLATQVEGMVMDDKTQKLYVGEEQKGIFFFDGAINGNTKGHLITSSTSKNSNIAFDIEGLAILPPYYLVASSQGNFSYAIFDLRDNSYVKSFVIESNVVDGVQETDGLDILKADLGSQFPMGVLVAQDGFNFDIDVKKNQNFKIVDLEQVINLLKK